jgi:hypothetical protein
MDLLHHRANKVHSVTLYLQQIQLCRKKEAMQEHVWKVFDEDKHGSGIGERRFGISKCKPKLIIIDLQ